MLLELRREELTPESTIGELFVDGEYCCRTLELPVKDGLAGSAIPPTGASSYMVKLSPSPKFMHLAENVDWWKPYANKIPHILGIPNRSDILIHVGNTPHDTLGCVIVGTAVGENSLANSRVAFAELMVALDSADKRGETIQMRIFGGTPLAQHPAADLSLEGDV